MTAVFIVIGAGLLATLFLAYRYDRRHRGLGGTSDGRTARQTRLHGREKGAEWGAGGG